MQLFTLDGVHLGSYLVGDLEPVGRELDRRNGTVVVLQEVVEVRTRPVQTDDQRAGLTSIFVGLPLAPVVVAHGGTFR